VLSLVTSNYPNPHVTVLLNPLPYLYSNSILAYYSDLLMFTRREKKKKLKKGGYYSKGKRRKRRNYKLKFEPRRTQYDRERNSNCNNG
jgi:hypothetical protein